MRAYLYLVPVAVALLVPLETDARVIRIPTDQPTIQQGLDSASYGDTVLVQTGTYQENIIWPETQDVHLLGDHGPNSTTIDGGGSRRVLTMAPGLESETRISGFTITNGFDSLGGGIYCFQSSPTIEYCHIQSNTAYGFGGGVYCEQSSPVIMQSVIAANFANRIGGGIFATSSSLPLINHNHIYGNGAYYGVYNADASVTVDATNNLWGTLEQEFGPFDPSHGPPDYNALWPNEMVSDYVTYRPWLVEPGVAEEEHWSLTDYVDGMTLKIGPNPMRHAGRIHYTLLINSSVSLNIYDASGRQVAKLFEGEKPAGGHTDIWCTTDVPAGVYFCRLRVYPLGSSVSVEWIDTKKIVLVR